MMGYQALLFSPDEKLARVASQVFTELDFTVEPAHEPFGAVKKLMTQHYDAIVVDCDNEQNASLLFRSARNSSPNHSSLAIALVEGQAGVAKAYRIGANLVLTKPINVEQAKGTLRVARGLLRKNSEAAGGSATSGTGHTIPASAAPVSAGSSPPWVRQGEAASTQPSSHPGLPEFEAPAFINDALPAGFERGLPGAFSAEFPTECPAEFPTTTASASVEDKPATQPAYPSVIKAYRPVIKNDAGKAGIVTNETARIAFTSLSTQNISSGFTSAGSAAAPAPAKEVTAPPARENHNNKENKQKENNQKEKNQVDDKHANRSHDAAPMLSVVPLLNGPAFSVLGEEDSGETGGEEKNLIAA